jgi:hypothetical protein
MQSAYFYATPSAPCCGATAKTFPDAQAALEYARTAADAFRVGWTVWRVLAGRPTRLAAFAPGRS